MSRDKRGVVDLAAGDIVGSTLLMTGAPAEDAVVVEPTRALRRELVKLERAANPDARIISV